MKHLGAVATNVAVLIASTSAFAQESLASQEKTVPGGTLMLVAYLVFVAMMLGYLALLSFRQRRLSRDIDGLEKRLDELAEMAPGADGRAGEP